jgi:hypothetical protein
MAYVGIGVVRVGTMAYVVGYRYWAWMGREDRILWVLVPDRTGRDESIRWTGMDAGICWVGIGLGWVGKTAYFGYWSRTGRDDGIGLGLRQNVCRLSYPPLFSLQTTVPIPFDRLFFLPDNEICKLAI